MEDFVKSKVLLAADGNQYILIKKKMLKVLNQQYYQIYCIKRLFIKYIPVRRHSRWYLSQEFK